MERKKQITGYQFKALRESKDMTQSEFASLLGYAHKQRILEIEKRKAKSIGYNTILRLKVAGIDIDSHQ